MATYIASYVHIHTVKLDGKQQPIDIHATMPHWCSSKTFHDIQQRRGMYQNDSNCQVLAKLQ